MKKIFRTLAAVFAAGFVFAFSGCETDTETVYVDKTYASAVTFTAAATDTGVSVAMATETNGAAIYYTTSGTVPTTENTLYTSAVEINSDTTFMAIAVKDGMENSPISYAKVSIATKTIIETKTETADTTSPAEVSDLAVTAANGNAVLTWANPEDSDFAGVKISASPAAGTLANAVTLDKGVTTFSASGLTTGSEYTFTIQSFDTSLNYSAGTSKTATVSDTSDKTAPAEVSDLAVTAANGNAVLTWTNPSDDDFAGVKISASPAAGTLVNSVTLDKGVTIFSASGLTTGSEYTFTVQTFDTSLNFSAGTSKTATVSDTADKTAPADITNLTATAKDSAVLLTWTDPSDEDLFGIEITYTSDTSTSSASRAISAMQEGSVFVAPGKQSATITNLTNGTSYTFTLKAMDLSGNKSNGVTSDSVSPKAISENDPLSIALSVSVPQENGYTGDKSNTSVTVTANITSASTVKNVVYKKDGTKVAADLLADEDATALTVSENDNAKWTFTLTATDESLNGTTYTVAALDEAGREETSQITLGDVFDFTAPAKVTGVSATYDSDESTITLTWTDPSDSDFDHVLISYITNDGESYSEESEAVSVDAGTQTYTLENVDGTVQYYKFTIKSVDSLGNTSSGLSKRCNILSTVPEGFVAVRGGTFDGTSTLTPSSSVFISGRSITIGDLYVCDHEVTQGEYETYCKYGSSSPSSTYGDGDNYPAYYVSWYDAIVYCNLRSIAEDLTPVYSISSETDPSKWTDIVSETTDGTTKYCGPTSKNTTWNSVTFDTSADGYRLPTEAEWEYVARGGSEWKTYTYSGSDTIGDVAWNSTNSSSSTHEVKTKAANSLEIYDMSGNVNEWCYDWYSSSILTSTAATGATSGSQHVTRGGSYLTNYNDSLCAVFHRTCLVPQYRNGTTGFRVVRNAE